MKRPAVAVFSMVGVALIAAGCVVSSAPEPASHTPEFGLPHVKDRWPAKSQDRCSDL